MSSLNFDDMDPIILPSFSMRYLQDVDSFLASNLHRLTCADIHEIYHQHFEDLKKIKGNANGFTGLSEYLIFRFIYHLLGGEFTRRRVEDSQDLWDFYQTDHNYGIGQAVPVTPPGKIYPDISIRKNNVLVAVIEIKLYLSGGQAEFLKELKRLERIRDFHPQIRALLIHFNRLSLNGKIYPLLEAARVENPWFDFIVLQGYQTSFAQDIERSLPGLL